MLVSPNTFFLHILTVRFLKTNYFFLTLALLSFWSVSSQSYGQTCSPISGGADTTVTSSCSDLVMDGAGNVAISTGVTISGSFDAAILITNGVSTKNLTINGDLSGRVNVDSSSSLNQIVNNGTITTYGGGINVWGNVNTVINNGQLISGSWWGIQAEDGATITNLINTGSILASSAVGLNGQILYITNTGTINSSSTDQGIMANNYGPLVLNNSQGAGNTYGPLTYRGILPTNYNIIINSPTSFGKLAVTSGTGSTTFGVYAGSSVSNNTKYAAVLSGVTSAQLINKSGTYGGYSWDLSLESGSSDVWDLIFGAALTPTGPSIANTNQSLVNTASALQGTYTLQNSVLANSFSYDCNVFGANNVCVSAGGRNTQVQATNGLNNTSALLIAAYRLNQNYRIGAYADQNLSVSNPGGTVNLGNNTPVIGLFGAWSQRLDGTGAEVKVSAAYGQKNTTVNRSVVGSGDGASEAGSGSSTLNSQGAQITAKYGFGMMDNVIVSPYIGVRYTQNNMGGYTEATSSIVTAPLTYSALNTNATTALAGVGASYKMMPTVTTFASVGVESDTNTSNGSYSATNASIGTLTPVNFNPNPVRTRPTATLGAYYDVAKNQRFGVTGIYRQEAYQAVSSTTVMATYTIGL
jgi:hypothetical protein